MGYVCTCASAYVQMCPHFPDFGNGWTDCAEIWYVVRDPLARVVKDGVQLHMRTCAPFFGISETAGQIALKFGMSLETD